MWEWSPNVTSHCECKTFHVYRLGVKRSVDVDVVNNPQI